MKKKQSSYRTKSSKFNHIINKICNQHRLLKTLFSKILSVNPHKEMRINYLEINNKQKQDLVKAKEV